MATNITAEWESPGADGRSATISKTVSIADVTVNSAPNNTGGWTTASVTADLAPGHYLGVADGVPPGYYRKTGALTFHLYD